MTLKPGGLFFFTSVLTVPLTATAAIDDNTFIFGPFKKANTALERLRSAAEIIRVDPVIREISRDEAHQLKPIQKVGSPQIETTRFQHYFKGIPVVGSEALHHAGPAGIQVSSYVSDFSLDTRPTVASEEAVAIARLTTQLDQLRSAPELKILPEATGTGSARLTWWISLEGVSIEDGGSQVILDAHNGRILADLSHRHTLHPDGLAKINVRQANSMCQTVDMRGRPTSIEQEKCKRTITRSVISRSADTAAREAFANSQATLRYYKTVHGRDSLDGKGMEINAFVHIGREFANAFWDSQNQIMAYGDGDNETFGSFTRALDVAGHEMTHGVITHTANLVYMGESGALNEAFADFFGKMIASDGDWAVGRKLFLDPSNAKGIRDLKDPGSIQAEYIDPATGQPLSKPYPSRMSELFAVQEPCNRLNDFCWVHVNSTIAGHAGYLLTQAIGKEKTEKLFYTLLTQYLGATSGFKALGEASRKACAQLYDPKICGKVADTLKSVGI